MFIGITGSTGGLGRRLTELVLERGHKVKCLVREDSDINFLKMENVELVFGDIRNPYSLEKFTTEIDVCIHTAAQVTSNSKETLIETNVNGTRNICEALLHLNKNCRLIYCSSIVVKNFRFYKKPFVSDYTLSKYYAEKVVDSYNKKIKTTVIYPGYILGKYDRAFLPHIVNMLKQGLDFFVRGGENNAPIIHVDDLCELFYQAMINKKSIGKKYVSLKRQKNGMHDVVKLIAIKLGYQYPKKIYPKFIARIYLKINTIMAHIFNARKLNLKLRSLNILSNHAIYFNNAYEDIGWKQKYTLEEAVENALLEYMKNDNVSQGVSDES